MRRLLKSAAPVKECIPKRPLLNCLYSLTFYIVGLPLNILAGLAKS